ncbi:hypothetical protein [Stigmatella erecta]|uniref:Uncharacterized protein n=1 Tax=Stigmatella erecta TaxID=83460 RepID=A0A1I0KYL3_9BACT|nr:hypothetical protein [Stigmatella erecta]SEU31596.1 hypothetical protein SAMN05443639_11665 [Stigmatella erecta]
MSAADGLSHPLRARCATDPEEAATGTCSRCGTFFCGRCVQTVLGRPYCGPCAGRPEVNYLERFRQKLWGRRDGWGWLAGMAGALFAALAVFLLLQGQLAQGALCAAGTAVCGAFFLGLPGAREAFIATPLVLALGSALQGQPETAVGLGLLALAALSLLFDTRNQLFFRRPVPEERLLRLWHVRENNPLARQALSVALGGLLLPLLAPLALLLGAWALKRVDPTAVPPIGRRGQALAALVLGAASLALWGLVLWPRLGLFLARFTGG